MAKRKKNSIDWLFNQRNAEGAVSALGARNLTVVKAVFITADREEEASSYDRMLRYNSEEADQKLIEWMRGLKEAQLPTDERYLYFRFIRWN